MNTNKEETTPGSAAPGGAFPGQGGQERPPDPRAEALKHMLLTLQEWLGSVPTDEQGMMAMETSTILSHNQAVGMWLTQLEQFGMMLQGQDEALLRLTNIATEVQQAGHRLGAEINARLPARAEAPAAEPEPTA
jgi:hypothetical protein